MCLFYSFQGGYTLSMFYHHRIFRHDFSFTFDDVYIFYAQEGLLCVFVKFALKGAIAHAQERLLCVFVKFALKGAIAHIVYMCHQLNWSKIDG